MRASKIFIFSKTDYVKKKEEEDEEEEEEREEEK